MPILKPIPRPSKADLIRALVLCKQISPEEKEFILNLPTDPSAPASNANHMPNSAVLQRLTQAGVIVSTRGSPALTYFGKVIQYRILLERELVKHPGWLEPTEGFE